MVAIAPVKPHLQLYNHDAIGLDITSVLEPTALPPYVVADLYRRRWRIEEAFNTVKRLLGLSYLWTGSLNGIQLQIWGTWFVLSGHQ